MDWKAQIILYVTLLYVVTSGQSEDGDQISTTNMPTLPEQHEIANKVNDFGYKLLLRMMSENKNENIVISPTAVAGLLAMTLLGSVGKTYDELATTLGFSQDILTNRKNHEELGNLFEMLNLNDTTSRTLYADAIFVDARTKLRDIYSMYLKRVYRGEVLNADFDDGPKAKDLINEWVKTNTNEKINNILKEPLPATTRIALLCALYFSGQWEHPFTPEHTIKMPFKAPNKEVNADLMLNYGRFEYSFSQDLGVHMIALPYKDNVTTMYALKPLKPKQLSLSDLMEHLNYTNINQLIDEKKNTVCIIRFPKMQLESSVKLEPYLKRLGINSMFVPGDANFALMIDSSPVLNKTEELITRINSGEGESKGLKEMVNALPNPGVHVDTVLHDVKMTIDEYGTEASAAAGGFLLRSATQFYADSPFHIFIRNERTKLITFSAVIFDPTIPTH